MQYTQCVHLALSSTIHLLFNEHLGHRRRPPSLFFRPSPSPGPGMSLMQRILLFVLSYIHYIISYIYNVYGISVYIYKYSTIHLYIISHHNQHHPKRHVTASFCFIFRRLRMRWHMHLAGIHLGW